MISEIVDHLKEGNFQAVLDSLYETAVDVNEPYNGESLLGYAVERHIPAIVQLLLQKGADPSFQNFLGNTPLMTLLDAGYTKEDTNIQHIDLNKNRQPEIPFEQILTLLVHRTDLKRTNMHGQTALHIALSRCLWDAALLLVREGAPLNIQTHAGETVFHTMAVQTGADAGLVVLQAMTPEIPTDLLNVRSASGQTALEGAAAFGNYRIAEHLVYKGAMVTPDLLDLIRDSEDGPLSELAEHITRKDDVLPPMRPQDLEVLFGVELEICAKLTPECAGESSGKRMNPDIFQQKEWTELFELFSRFILKKSPKAALMRKRYDHMYVSSGQKYGVSHILNLNTFRLEELSEVKKITYDRPFFTVDRSVVCGDYRIPEGHENRRPNYMPAIDETFHLELVSPILTSLDELRDLLEFLGMRSTACFVANDSAGFHVNVSLRNKVTQKPIPLTADFFTRTFFPRYRSWEAKLYPRVRTGITEYAKCIGGIEVERFPQLYREICENKYVTVHRKDVRELVEFRLFGSTNDLNRLVMYTDMATQFLRDAYLEWYHFYKPTLDQTDRDILGIQTQLRRSLLGVEAKLRARKTAKLRKLRNTLQRNLRTVGTLRFRNAKGRIAALNTLKTHTKNM